MTYLKPIAITKENSSNLIAATQKQLDEDNKTNRKCLVIGGIAALALCLIGSANVTKNSNFLMRNLHKIAEPGKYIALFSFMVGLYKKDQANKDVARIKIAALAFEVAEPTSNPGRSKFNPLYWIGL